MWLSLAICTTYVHMYMHMQILNYVLWSRRSANTQLTKRICWPDVVTMLDVVEHMAKLLNSAETLTGTYSPILHSAHHVWHTTLRPVQTIDSSEPFKICLGGIFDVDFPIHAEIFVKFSTIFHTQNFAKIISRFICVLGVFSSFQVPLCRYGANTANTIFNTNDRSEVRRRHFSAHVSRWFIVDPSDGRAHSNNSLLPRKLIHRARRNDGKNKRQNNNDVHASISPTLLCLRNEFSGFASVSGANCTAARRADTQHIGNPLVSANIWMYRMTTIYCIHIEYTVKYCLERIIFPHHFQDECNTCRQSWTEQYWQIWIRFWLNAAKYYIAHLILCDATRNTLPETRTPPPSDRS